MPLLVETIDEPDDIEFVPLALPLDRATVAWLAQVSCGSDCKAAEFIAFIVRKVRENDEWERATLQ